MPSVRRSSTAYSTVRSPNTIHSSTCSSAGGTRPRTIKTRARWSPSPRSNKSKFITKSNLNNTSSSSNGNGNGHGSYGHHPPSLDEYLQKRDYVGASTFLDFQSSTSSSLCNTSSTRSTSSTNSVVQHLLWKGYCAFHNDELDKAQDIYMDLLQGDYGKGGSVTVPVPETTTTSTCTPDREVRTRSDGEGGEGGGGSNNNQEKVEDAENNSMVHAVVPKETALYLACAYVKNQMYEEAMDAAEEGSDCPLKHRIMHLALHKWNANRDRGTSRRRETGDEDHDDDEENEDTKDRSTMLKQYQQKLIDSPRLEDQLSRAAVLFDQGAYQDAIDIYKRLLMEHNRSQDRVALNVYIALCYFKMVRSVHYYYSYLL